MENGYSEIAIYFALLAGLSLSLFKPDWVLYSTIFIFFARDSQAANLTRTSLFGPYLNLDDTLCVCMLFAGIVLLYRGNYRFIFPFATILILICIFIGAVEIGLNTSYTYEVLREIRWAVTFPLTFLILANAVRSENQLRPILVSILIGSVLAAIQHILYVLQLGEQRVSLSGEFSATRTLAFVSGGAYLLIATPHLSIAKKSLVKGLIYLSVGLMGVSVVLNQTRSYWISIIVSTMIIGFMTGRINKYWKIIAVGIMGLSVIGIIMAYLIPDLDVVSIVSDRIGSAGSDDASSMSRWRQIEREMSEWYVGNWVTGLGIGFSSLLEDADDVNYVAWGHIGHISYLARLGFIGSIVYSVYLPLKAVKIGKEVVSLTTDTRIFTLGMIGLSCVINDWIMFFMSGSYLFPSPLQGILYGILWGLSSNLNLNRLEEKVTTHRFDLSLNPS